MCNSTLLVAHLGDTTLDVQVKELWKTYANTLTLIAATILASDPPAIEYLLEEDEDTLGFEPFQGELLQERYSNQEMGAPKPLFHALNVKRQHPNVEMLGRICDILTDGVSLARNEVRFIRVYMNAINHFAEHSNRDFGRNNNICLS